MTEPAQEELRKNWRMALAVWWAMSWRIFLGWFAVMAVATYAQQELFVQQPEIGQLLVLGTLLLVPPIGVAACWLVLNKNFRRFRLAVVPRREENTAKIDASQQQKDEINHTKAE